MFNDICVALEDVCFDPMMPLSTVCMTHANNLKLDVTTFVGTFGSRKTTHLSLAGYSAILPVNALLRFVCPRRDQGFVWGRRKVNTPPCLATTSVSNEVTRQYSNFS
jgi:hypothetical protein